MLFNVTLISLSVVLSPIFDQLVYRLPHGHVTPLRRIEPRRPRIDVKLKHEPPALVNEFYELQLAIESLEDTPVKELR